MNIRYMDDTGGRHEWHCEHCDEKYVVSYHYGDNKSWTVQRLRDDGLREVLKAGEAERLLREFPTELAFGVSQTPGSGDNEEQTA